MTEEQRYKILAEIARHTGKIVPAAFVKRTSLTIPWIERFHNLITGIYKPAGSEFALSIATKPTSPYSEKDDIVFVEDGRWLMEYSPRAGGLEISDNRALMKCKENGLPIGVFLQTTSKNSPSGATYRVLGLGIIADYSSEQDVFVIESIDLGGLNRVTNFIYDEHLRYETQIYAQITNKFQPFVKEENATYIVNAPKRDQAFRRIGLQEYKFACALCQMMFKLGMLTEATAAHIVPKHKDGTDDPRNGLSLCRTHHWIFDQGFFSIDDDYRVLISPFTRKAAQKNFPLEEFEGQTILMPQDSRVFPHPEALRWHRENVWRS